METKTTALISSFPCFLEHKGKKISTTICTDLKMKGFLKIDSYCFIYCFLTKRDYYMISEVAADSWQRCKKHLTRSECWEVNPNSSSCTKEQGKFSTAQGWVSPALDSKEILLKTGGGGNSFFGSARQVQK